MDKPDDPIEKLRKLQKQHAGKVTPIKRRLIENSVKIGAKLADDILFQHTVFCQTVLPYRDPGPEVRIWEREQGNVSLSIEAGRAKNPQGQFVPVGLPFGTAARLILCHLNTEALRTSSPVIEIEGSMTAFIARLQGFSPNGAQIRKFKDQLIRLSTSIIRLVAVQETSAVQINTQIVSAFDLWVERLEEERFLFQKKIQLSMEYFANLQEHAIPLDERAVIALAHSAMGLDIYCWLAQRLHRVDPKRGQFVPWTALHQQFGQGYEQIRQFRAAFLQVLKVVKTQYPAARFGIDKGGMMLGNSPPPVQRPAVLVGSPPLTLAPPMEIPNAQMLSLPPPSEM
ncbi:MAG TPA: replication protein RepA [Candidatus Competibacter sp.]|nr:replication protein RepA [Candidatus Competibacter sp.]